MSPADKGNETMTNINEGAAKEYADIIANLDEAERGILGSIPETLEAAVQQLDDLKLSRSTIDNALDKLQDMIDLARQESFQ